MKALLLILLCMVMLTCRKDVAQQEVIPQFVEVIDTLYTDWELFMGESLDGKNVCDYYVYPDKVLIEYDECIGRLMRCRDTLQNCPYKEIRLSYLVTSEGPIDTIFSRFCVGKILDDVLHWEYCVQEDTLITSDQTKYFEYSLSGPWPETAVIGIDVARFNEIPATLTLTDLCIVGIREEPVE